MPRFMLQIWTDTKRAAEADPAEMEGLMGEYFAYTQALVEAGALRGGDPLHPVDTARTVGTGGVITDGPFAELAEHLGGYYLIEVADMDEACEWAKKLPGVARGLDRIEVRQIVDLPPDMMP